VTARTKTILKWLRWANLTFSLLAGGAIAWWSGLVFALGLRIGYLGAHSGVPDLVLSEMLLIGAFGFVVFLGARYLLFDFGRWFIRQLERYLEEVNAPKTDEATEATRTENNLRAQRSSFSNWLRLSAKGWSSIGLLVSAAAAIATESLWHGVLVFTAILGISLVVWAAKSIW
jgi:hypothetical protein